MNPLPHHYRVDSTAAPEGAVTLSADGLPELPSAAPREFGGPGDQWSPESLLVSSVASCFLLTFRAIARASKLDWTTLGCSVEGTLDRVEGVTRFVAMRLVAHLTLPDGANPDAGRRLLEKAEKTCLITNSLDLEVTLEVEVEVG